MKTLYCGLELGSSKCQFSLVNEAKEEVLNESIPTSEYQLTAFLGSLQKEGERVKVHMESGELVQWVRGIIMENTNIDIEDVIVGDSKKNSWIAKDPHKKDRIDAYKLAELLRLGRTHPVYYSNDKNILQFKKQVQHHESLTKEVGRIKNQIKAALRRVGIIIKSNAAYSKKNRQEILRSIENPIYRQSVGDMYELLENAEKLAKKAKKRVMKMSENWPIIEYFMEVPGVGPILACRFVAYVQTPWRFSSKEKLWAYSRLGLTDRSSDGKPLGSKRLDKNGIGTLKDLSRRVFETAKKKNDNNAFKRAYYRYLNKTHNEMHARLSVQRKVLTVLWTMWRKNERYDDRRG